MAKNVAIYAFFLGKIEKFRNLTCVKHLTSFMPIAIPKNYRCRMFGYPEGAPTKNSHFGTLDTSSFAMDNVQCTGSEATILDCPHFTVDDCGTSEGAGVICSGFLSKIVLNEKLNLKKMPML